MWPPSKRSFLTFESKAVRQALDSTSPPLPRHSNYFWHSNLHPCLWLSSTTRILMEDQSAQFVSQNTYPHTQNSAWHRCKSSSMNTEWIKERGQFVSSKSVQSIAGHPKYHDNQELIFKLTFTTQSTLDMWKLKPILSVKWIRRKWTSLKHWHKYTSIYRYNKNGLSDINKNLGNLILEMQLSCIF